MRLLLLRRQGESGFSLVEMMVGMALLAIVMTLAFGQLAAGVDQTARLDRGADENGAIRLVVESMVRELRQASTGDISLYPIAAASTTEITFYSPDGGQPKHLRKITYQLVNGTLQRSELVSTNTGKQPWVFSTTPAAFRTVLTGVINVDLFAYVDGTGVATTSAASVRAMSIKFERKSALSAAAERLYRTGIELRGQQ